MVDVAVEVEVSDRDDNPAGSAAAAEDVPQVEEPNTREEVRRLCQLMTEQQRHMTQLLARQTESEVSDGLLGLIFNGQEAEALNMVRNLRPAALANMADPSGMNALHWAVRTASLPLVFALLEKAPQLANGTTGIGRNPPHWTPLMILADQTRSANPNHQQMTSALCSHMSLNALMTRGGTLATVSHLAAGRGNLHVLKRVLWRIFDCGGQEAVIAHLAIANSTASRQQYVLFQTRRHTATVSSV